MRLSEQETEAGAGKGTLVALTLKIWLPCEPQQVGDSVSSRKGILWQRDKEREVRA